MYTVYILKCSDNTYYVGCTNDMNDRFSRHQKGRLERLRVSGCIVFNHKPYRRYPFNF